MRILVFAVLLLFYLPITIKAQNQPCKKMIERPIYSTGPHPKIHPIFPGCEDRKGNNNSLDRCTRKVLLTKILEKLGEDYDTISMNYTYFEPSKLTIKISENGKLNLKFTKSNQSKIKTSFRSI